MGYLKNVTGYFRQSLIDRERSCPKDKNLHPILGIGKEQKNTQFDYLALDHKVWLSGEVPEDQVSKIFEQKREPKQKTLETYDDTKIVELLMLPRIDLLRYRGGSQEQDKPKILVPLLAFVTLDRNGLLTPSNKAPWIPREWLSPNEHALEIIAEAAAVDRFMTQNPFEGIATWSQLVDYSTKMLDQVRLERGILANQEQHQNQSEGSIFDFKIHQDYTLCPKSLLQVEVLPVVGATKKMRVVLEKLLQLKENNFPQLYQNYVSHLSPTLQESSNAEFDTALAGQHVAQMTGEFPLAPKQRSALHHVLKHKDGEILAINGPPGTGKTTLLRSVVANLWIQAALDKSKPPLIVATSSNNQAITNILDSFAKIDESGIAETLQGRWLPEVNSYGLYCCSRKKVQELEEAGKEQYIYHGPNGEGQMYVWQQVQYRKKAKKEFLEKVSLWHGKSVTDLTIAMQAVHEAMQQRQQKMLEGIEILSIFESIYQQVATQGGIEHLQATLESLQNRWDTNQTNLAQRKFQLDQLYDLWERRSIWTRLSLTRISHKSRLKLLKPNPYWVLG